MTVWGTDSEKRRGEPCGTQPADRFHLNRASGRGLHWSMELPPAPSAPDITASLRLILRGILAALGMWRLEPRRAVVLYNRISGTFGQIERLLARFRAGRLWRLKPRATAQRRSERVPGRGDALPRRFGWLMQAGGHQAMGFGLQLQTVLHTPEMVELLAASPQAGRLLRPLCRALAVEVPWVHTAPKPRAERAKRIRKPRPKPAPFKIPLPRGVLSAARRAGFGKLC